MNKPENNKIGKIGDSFYETCEANEQSGKTLWIGIERGKNFKWVVSISFLYYKFSCPNGPIAVVSKYSRIWINMKELHIQTLEMDMEKVVQIVFSC